MSHVQVQYNGSSPDGEVWSTSLRFALTSSLGGGPSEGNLPGFTPAMLQACADAVAGANTGNVWPTNMRGLLSNALSITDIRVNEFTPNDTLIGAAETALPAPVSGAGSLARPLQTAMAVTLNYGAQYGRNYRGRIFLPACAGPAILATTGRISAATRNTLVTEIGAWIMATAAIVNTELGGDGMSPVIYSRKMGLLRRVNNVNLGDVLDTQRRRRDKLREQRTQVGI